MFDIPDRKTYGAKPFWAWNGKLEKNELLRQIEIMKEMGFGGFFMHSRTGLVTEYLGKEWFELINACADKARELGMEAWLYDEDRWPSGSAGGLATVEEKYRMKYLRMTVVIPSVFEWTDDIIAAFAGNTEGADVTNCIQISEHTEVSELEAKNIIYFTTETMAKSDYYNGYTYLDTMSERAVNHFMDITHEKYRTECGDRLGKSIKGIFTDEPHRGDVMCGFCSPNREPFFLTPYTDNLFEEFEKAFGYKLQENLPELFLRIDGKKVSRVKWHYMEILTRLFLKNFGKTYYDRCHDCHMLSTGHVLHEDTLSAQSAMMGSVMRYYEFMDYPGVDVLTEYNTSYCIVKQLSSVARQTGKKFLLSELDGCTGWQMTFRDYKAIGDWQAIMGITLRCPHLSWYTMRGEAKRDYPASILHQSSWYKAYSALEDHYTRISEIVANSERECDVLVISPVESVWAQIYTGWAESLSPVSPEIISLEEKFRALYNALLAHQTDFDYADEEMLSRLSAAEGKFLRVGEARYKKVIIYAMTTVRKTTLDILENFAAGGGEVIFIDEPPLYMDALPSDIPSNFAKTVKNISFGDISQLTPATHTDSKDIILQKYKDDKNTYYLLLNTKRKENLDNVTVFFGEQILPQLWDTETGKKYELGDSTDSLSLDFEPGELKIIVDAGECLNDALPLPGYTVKERVYAENRAKISLAEPNVCVLDYVTYSVNGEASSEETEVLIADRQIRKQLGIPERSGSMLQPWMTAKKPLEKKADVKLSYKFVYEGDPAEPLFLLIEEPENFDISINGRQVNKTYEPGIFIDSCFYRINISEYTLTGENTVDLTTAYKENTNLESLYLLGKFRVTIPDKKIVPFDKTVSFGSLTRAGFPFYGGELTYTLSFPKKPAADERAVLKLGGYENAACFKVGDKYIPFYPFECDVTEELRKKSVVDVTVYLTRRNMFGPLHGIDKHPGAIGPEHFYGGQSRDYVLFESGIPETPYLEIRTNGGDAPDVG